MNIMFFLTPKENVQYVYDTDTLRQVLEKMDHHQYASIPIIRESNGAYCGTLTEGDLLREIMHCCNLTLRKAEDIPLRDIPRRRDYLPVRADSDIEGLLNMGATQNFVPVIDDSGAFIGIITRKELMRYLINTRQASEKSTKNDYKMIGVL